MRNLRLKASLHGALFAWLALTLTGAEAGSFMVDPTRIELGADQMSATLVIRNDDQEPTVIRVESRAWRQKDGEDIYEATSEILITPPVVTVAPGSEQILRVALRRPLDGKKELSYRIFLLEVPPPPRPGFRGLQVALRISLPVFALPAAGATSKTAWRLAYQAKEHALRVDLANTGDAHMQMQEFSLSAPGRDTPLAIRQSVQYVLAGQSYTWLIKLDPAVRITGKRLRLKAVTNEGHVDTELDLDTP